MSDQVLVLEDVVESKYHRVSKPTRWRQEREGLFPQRVKIGKRRVAWRTSELDEWAADPAAWAAKHANKAAAS